MAQEKGAFAADPLRDPTVAVAVTLLVTKRAVSAMGNPLTFAPSEHPLGPLTRFRFLNGAGVCSPVVTDVVF